MARRAPEAGAALTGGRADPTANSCTSNGDKAPRKKCTQILELIGSVAVAVPARLHATYMNQPCIHMGKAGETVKHAALSKNSQSNSTPPAVPVALRIAPVRSARIRLRDQIERVDSRSCGSTTVPSAVAARAPAGNCSTVARWPSHKRVTSTTCPSGNSSAS